MQACVLGATLPGVHPYDCVHLFHMSFISLLLFFTLTSNESFGPMRIWAPFLLAPHPNIQEREDTTYASFPPHSVGCRYLI